LSARSWLSGGGVTHIERRWVLGFAVLVVLFTSIPYLLGFATQSVYQVYTGFVFGVEDGNSYIAKMLSGAFGAWKFYTPYTAYPQAGAWVFPFYIWLGKLASPPGLHVQLVAIFHLLRAGAVILTVLASYDFLAFFLADVHLRRFGLALATLGGGLGWLIMLLGGQIWLGSMPLEFYSPEAFGFLSLYGLPHLALARALLLWALLVYLRAVAVRPNDQKSSKSYPIGKPGDDLDVLGSNKQAGRTWLVVASLCILWLLIGLVQPLTMLVLGALLAWHLAGLGIWQLVRQGRSLLTDWPRWRRLAGIFVVAGILPGMFILYNAWISYSDPYIHAWSMQNLIRSPNPIHYLLAYGILLPFAVWGGRRLLRDHAWTGWLPVGWVLLFPVLAYAPIDLQRRLTEGVWIAWVALAMVALDNLPQIAQASRRRWLILPMWLLFPSTVLLLAGGLQAVRHPGMPLFRPKDEVRVFEFLQSQEQAGQVVLAAYETGNPLPAWAPVRVVIGHGPESANLARLEPQVAAFYTASTPDAQRIELIRQFDVRYVFWGPAERRLGDWSPYQANYLQPVYQAGEYELFQVALTP
jgi:hypothetical protein